MGLTSERMLFCSLQRTVTKLKNIIKASVIDNVENGNHDNFRISPFTEC